MMDIKELRERINEIDEQIVCLFCERIEAAKKIADYKKENSLPVLDSEREKAVLDFVSARAGDENAARVRDLYEKIFEISRSCQQSLIDKQTEEDK